jgi:PEGA domain
MKPPHSWRRRPFASGHSVEIGGIAYGEAVLPISSLTRPHRTSLAVWAVPSPVQIASRLAITVGANSSGACALGGARIEIRDDTGAVVGEGILGETPWPGSGALYWTQIVLASPPNEGLQCWTVGFAATDLELPHLASSAQFSFTAVKPPEHRVAIAVMESDVAAPVEKTEIALGPYRAATDKTGMAHIEVPGGTYELAVWKSGFRPASKTVEIAADAAVQFELVRLPKELTVWD